VTCDRFSPGPPVSSTNKTDCHNITEILLKVALNTNKQTTIFSHLANFCLQLIHAITIPYLLVLAQVLEKRKKKTNITQA